MMLAAVEHQQKSTALDCVGDLLDGIGRPHRQAQRRRHGPRGQISVSQRRQIDEGYFAILRRDHLLRHGQGDRGLAHAARADDRQQALLGQQGRQFADQGVAADDLADGRGKTADRRPFGQSRLGDARRLSGDGDHRHGRDEAVAAPGHVGDQANVADAVAQGLPQSRDVHP